MGRGLVLDRVLLLVRSGLVLDEALLMAGSGLESSLLLSGSGLANSLLQGPGLHTGLLYARSMLRELRPRRSAVQPGSGPDGPLLAWDSEVTAPDTMQLADSSALAVGSKLDGTQMADSSALAAGSKPDGMQLADSSALAAESRPDGMQLADSSALAGG